MIYRNFRVRGPTRRRTTAASLMRSALRITITFFGMENGTFTGKKFAD